MIKFQQLPDNIESLIPLVTAYLKSNPHIIFVYLFGSLAKGKQQPLSDIDIAVYLKQGADVVECKLAILGRPIHIQCSYPSRSVIKIITLYEPDPVRWIDFKKRRP